MYGTAKSIIYPVDWLIQRFKDTFPHNKFYDEDTVFKLHATNTILIQNDTLDQSYVFEFHDMFNWSLSTYEAYNKKVNACLTLRQELSAEQNKNYKLRRSLKNGQT